jgi:predicted acyl esterase
VTVTEPADDIVSDRDAEIATRDGTILRANVFRSPDNRAYPDASMVKPSIPP